MKRYNVLLLLIISVTCLKAQISLGGTPYSFTHTVGDSIPTLVLPYVNVDSLLQVDALDTSLHPFRFGFAHEVIISPDNAGIWETLPDSSMLWRLGITSPGAYALNLLFDDFYLPTGLELFVYNSDTTTILGAFTAANNKPYRKFSTAQIMGDFIFLELYIPSSVAETYAMHLFNVVHDYVNFFSIRSGGGDRSAPCQINIACENGNIWQDVKRSVVLIMMGNGYCSGALINQTAPPDPFDPDQYNQLLFTASHCFLGGYDPGNWLFYFNYESVECEPTTNGSLDQTSSGAELLVYEQPITSTDISLLSVSTQIPDSFNVYYAGWDRNQFYGESTICIHHPQAEVKKIAYDNNAPPGYFNDFKYLINFDDGDVEYGSSGAPLFTNSGLIIGQVHAGLNDNFCEDSHDVIYGKFYQSWDNLSQYLDPAGLSPNFLLGSDPGCTDQYAYNYNPDAKNDDGSCYGEEGDINLDGCVNVIDVVLLVDFVLNQTGWDDYEFWAGDKDDNGSLNGADLLLLVDYILNNPTCTGVSQRADSNSFITFNHMESLSRGISDITEIILSTENEVRAAHFEFEFQGLDILEVYMVDEFTDMSLDWTTRGDTLAILFYGAEGQAIQQGSHTVVLIESSGALGRDTSANIGYFSGEYASDADHLYMITLGDEGQQTQFIPNRFALHQPYPNPFNPVTTISFDLPEEAMVNLSVYNLNGELVTVLKSGLEFAGSYEIKWEAKNLSSGLYFIRLSSGDYVKIHKVLLLK